MKKFYTPAVQSQRQVNTLFQLAKIGKDYKGLESAICPFCGLINIGIHRDDLKPGYLEKDVTCNHFSDFVSGGGNIITILFYGWSDELENMENS